VKVGLGVCAHNEASTIVATLSSIVQSASQEAEPCDWLLMVCANGCTDGTARVVKQWIRDQRNARITLCELEDANLVEAQRVIAARLRERGADLLGFFDADVLVAPDCIPRMLEAAADESVQAVYATSIPFPDTDETLVARMLNQYDRDSRVFSPRKHLHGRAFLIREWHVPRATPPLLADDIFISCDLLVRHGERSIKACSEAKVLFHQISSVEDFYRSFKRRRIELRKCLRLDPGFKQLPPDQLNRRVIWKALLAERPGAVALWLTFLAMRLYCRFRFVADTFIGWNAPVWRPTTSSKKPFSV
jgi:glycosyltransferase involved in cell wall biosynthesis